MNVSAPQAAPSVAILSGYGLHKVQRLCGWLTMLIFLAGFAALVDGLTAEMQRGPNRIDALPGSVTPLSGPIPVKKAELEDFFVLGNAPDGQVRLELDDFFSSYWFGSGMWRGRLVVGDNPGIGEYPLVVEFRDAPPKAAQQYRVVVWADAEALRQGSYSWMFREYGQEPFRMAAVLLVLGVAGALGNFVLGRFWQRRLRAQGCAEIYKVLLARESGKEVTFGLGRADGVALGQEWRIMRPDGTVLGQSRVAFCEPRHASLLVPDSMAVRPGDVAQPVNVLTPEKEAQGANHG